MLYAITLSAHGNVAAGLVGGVLGGLVVYLLLKERDERRVRRYRSGPRR